MAQLEREALAHYLNTMFGQNISAAKTSAAWEIIGEDIEEMSMELNPDTESYKTILGKTKTKDNGYEPSMDADPFYADPDSNLYVVLRDIALNRLKGDACRTQLLEVIVEDVTATNHLAYVQNVIVKPQSYGGDTAGLNIPFNIAEDGDRVKGYVTLTDGVPVFTEGDIPSGE